MKKSITNTSLALLITTFVLTSVIYSFIVNKPIYKVTTFLQQATMIVSIISIAIHINALKEKKEKKKILLLSLMVSVTVIIYLIVGVISWYKGGI